MSSHDVPDPVSRLAGPPPDAVVRYAAHDDGLVDVHLPDAGGHASPLVVLLHGGFWKQAYDRRHTRPMARALAGAGYVVATPEYRRVGGGGGWPATADDVRRAVTRAPELLTGLGVPTSGLCVVGHSAGGHLALWLAGEGCGAVRVVGVAPVADLRAAAALRLGGGATQALLGGEPEAVPGRYDEADPATRLAVPPACEVRVVHGTEDDQVPLSLSQGLAARCPHVELRVLPGADHFDVIDPGSAAWPAVLAALS